MPKGPTVYRRIRVITNRGVIHVVYNVRSNEVALACGKVVKTEELYESPIIIAVTDAEISAKSDLCGDCKRTVLAK
jgi:hypothetical protein